MNEGHGFSRATNVVGSFPATDQRVPHISLVFREMWETRTFMFLAGRAEKPPVKRRGLPHLAKNERDMGHPLLRGTRTKNRIFV